MHKRRGEAAASLAAGLRDLLAGLFPGRGYCKATEVQLCCQPRLHTYLSVNDCNALLTAKKVVAALHAAFLDVYRISPCTGKPAWAVASKKVLDALRAAADAIATQAPAFTQPIMGASLHPSLHGARQQHCFIGPHVQESASGLCRAPRAPTASPLHMPTMACAESEPGPVLSGQSEQCILIFEDALNLARALGLDYSVRKALRILEQSIHTELVGQPDTVSTLPVVPMLPITGARIGVLTMPSPCARLTEPFDNGQIEPSREAHTSQASLSTNLSMASPGKDLLALRIAEGAYTMPVVAWPQQPSCASIMQARNSFLASARSTYDPPPDTAWQHNMYVSGHVLASHTAKSCAAASSRSSASSQRVADKPAKHHRPPPAGCPLLPGIVAANAPGRDMRQLACLNLQLERLTSLGSALKPCSALVHLSLAHNSLTSVAGISHCRCLTKLDLSHNALKSLEGLQPLRSLQVLNAAHNRIAHLEGLEESCVLRDLVIACNCIAGLSKALCSCPLETLDICGNLLSGLAALGAIRGSLLVLLLDGNELSAGTLGPDLAACTSLRHLSLAKNHAIGDLLPCSLPLALLTCLHLNGCGLSKLRPLPWLPHLRLLYLQDNNLTQVEFCVHLMP